MPKKPRFSYFLIYAIIGLLATFIGFGGTYIVPMQKGELEVPIGVHIHAAFAFSWILLYLTQTFLIHKRNYKVHMTLGWFSVVSLVGFLFSLLPAIAFVIERDRNVLGDVAYSSNMAVVTSGVWVLALGMSGLYYRKKPLIHKRLMFLATIVILWPAWARWRHYFPGISNGDYWFGLVVPYTFIISAWIWEKIVFGRIHKTLLGIGSLIILEGLMSSYYMEWEFTVTFIKWLYSLI